MKPGLQILPIRYIAPMADSDGPGVGTYLGNLGTESDTNSFVVPNASFGPASLDRVIIVGTGGQYNGASIINVTVSDITAALLISTTSGPESVALFAALVPTGTSGDIVVNLSNNAFRQNVFWWSCTGRGGSTAASDTASSASSSATSIDVPANGVVFGYAQSASAGGSGAIWTELTEDDEGDVGISTNKASGAHKEYANALSGVTVACDLAPVVFASL